MSAPYVPDGELLQLKENGIAISTYQMRAGWWIPVVPCEACGHMLATDDRSEWVEHAKYHI